MDNIDDKLPRIPKLTDKQLEINDAEQKYLAERSGLPMLGEKKRKKESQKAIEKEIARFEARGTIFNRAHAIIQESESIPLKEMVPIQRVNYAQALADVGKFREAARIAQDSEKKVYYRGIDKAVWLDDDKRCKCSDTQAFDKDKNPVTHDRHFIVKEIWSEKHGKKMNLWKCNKCGGMNVRE